jgi:hypothetical protein
MGSASADQKRPDKQKDFDEAFSKVVLPQKKE